MISHYNHSKKQIEKMRNITKEISEIFEADGQNEQYITLFESYEHLIEEGFIRILTQIVPKLTLEKVTKLKYPIITFDESCVDGGIMFEADATKEEILNVAKEYFRKKVKK